MHRLPSYFSTWTQFRFFSCLKLVRFVFLPLFYHLLSSVHFALVDWIKQHTRLFSRIRDSISNGNWYVCHFIWFCFIYSLFFSSFCFFFCWNCNITTYWTIFCFEFHWNWIGFDFSIVVCVKKAKIACTKEKILIFIMMCACKLHFCGCGWS